MRIGLEDSHKGSLNKERRYGRIEGVERLHIGKRRIVSQDAERDCRDVQGKRRPKEN